jgi:hypothetical protein
MISQTDITVTMDDDADVSADYGDDYDVLPPCCTLWSTHKRIWCVEGCELTVQKTAQSYGLLWGPLRDSYRDDANMGENCLLT